MQPVNVELGAHMELVRPVQLGTELRLACWSSILMVPVGTASTSGESVQKPASAISGEARLSEHVNLLAFSR